MKDLHKLPAGARFTAREGQATAELEMKGDTLFITATCDSLQQVIYQYEKTLAFQTDMVGKLTEKVKTATPFIPFLWGVLAGIILTVTAIFILKFKQK